MTTNVDSGFRAEKGSTVGIYGPTMTFWKTLLAANAAASATSLTTADSTGWANGDSIALASTTQTASQCEKKAMGAGASGTSIGTIAALTNAHNGTSPTQAELLNLTRGAKILGTSSSLQAYVFIDTTATVTFQYVELNNLGSATANKRGLDIQTTTGSCSITFCSLHDFSVASSIGVLMSSAGTNHNNITFSSNAVYNIANVGVQLNATTNTTNTLDSNAVILTGGVAFNIGDVGCTVTNNTAVGSTSHGFTFSESATSIGTFSGNTAHSNGGYGFNVQNFSNGAVGSTTSWRNSFGGYNIGSIYNCTFTTITAFGNAGANIFIAQACNLIFSGVTSSSDSTFTTASGINMSTFATDIFVDTSTFGVASGIKTAHTQDVICNSGVYQTLFLNNCNLASTTPVATQSNMPIGSFVASGKNGQSAGAEKVWKPTGNITSDSVVYNTVSPSLRITPSTASFKTDSGQSPSRGTFTCSVASGTTCTVTVAVRKSVIGDAGGATYNGNQPRLIVKRNASAGITADTVLATATNAANGAFETQTGVTASVADDCILEFVVDCDGTAGWVNVDTWTQGTPVDSRGMKYPLNGAAIGYGDNSSGGGITAPCSIYGAEGVQVCG